MSACRCPRCAWTISPESLVEKTTKVRKSGLTFAAEAGHPAPARRYQQKRHLGADRARLPHCLLGRVHFGQALLYDGPAHRDTGRYQGYCRYRPAGRGSLLQNPQPPEGQGRTGDDQRGLLCAQARHAVPVLRPGPPRSPAREAEISAQLCAFPQRSRSTTTTAPPACWKAFSPRATAGMAPRYRDSVRERLRSSIRWEEYFDYDTLAG